MKNRPILIISGDPESTFNEILIKTLNNKVLKNIKFPIVIIGSKKLLENQIKKTKKKINFQKYDARINLSKKKIYLIDIPLDYRKLTPMKKNSYIEKSFELGLKLVNEINSLAFINGPISKTTFLKGKHSGITEYLAFKTGSVNEVMIIFNKQLSVSPITTHVPINMVAKKIKKKIIISKINRINDFYKKFLGFKPNIAVTGLNPHCETFVGKNIEKLEILPAINFLKKKKINILGPFSADTIFLKDNRKKFNVIVGMYHDQVLAPIKTIFGFDAINITIGLPFVRITPDHGPNYKMFGLNKSKPDSLIQALSFINKYVAKA
ncbi:MAG: 4-hydroxythreonine-4-phosphate dehydrogenase PdxA [Candidatus Pelagibacter sp.]|tara:strand:- start:1634 stop:2599 length:966 start_codon:yes stop_codon:yes gene_type:complete